MTKAPFLVFIVVLSMAAASCEKGKTESAAGSPDSAVSPPAAPKPVENLGEQPKRPIDKNPTPAPAAPTQDERPDLRVVDAPALQAAIRDAKSRFVMVNMWATWCAPCVEEMPDIIKFYREKQSSGLALLLVSADLASQKNETLAFLRKVGVDFPSYLQSGDEDAFINTMNPDWDGALPATFFFDKDGKLLKFIGEPVTYASLKSTFAELDSPAP
ncbi:MAG: redoxin domain-containing protein [Myxococcota bacterium]|jgi:thiol-disulfide isomerase/thioredoxin|nr:redoxin domain-containing protein [Myxococcota bacterium]